MKGFTLLSDIFMLFTLIGVSVLMVTFVYVIWLTHGTLSKLGITGPQQIALTLFYKPVQYDSTLMSFLELTNSSIPMKDLLEQVAIQNSTYIWLNGESIDVSSVSNRFMKEILNRPYILKIVKPEITIASNGFSKSYEKISTKLFLLDGKYVSLEFYVG